jgi:hypothetical protein
MKKIIYSLLFGLISGLMAQDIGVVDTNVLLIKGDASNKSPKLGYYRNGEIIDILEKVNGFDSDEKWLKTPRGYVKEAYVIENIELSQLLNDEQIDGTKKALQVAVVGKEQQYILFKHRKLLKGYNNVYIGETKKALVLYLVNYDSFAQAMETKIKISDHFPDAFVINLRPQKSSTTIVGNKIVKNKPKKNIVQKEIVKNKIPKANDSIDMNEIDNIISSLDEVEDIALEPIKKKAIFKKEPIVKKPATIKQPVSPIVVAPIEVEKKKIIVKKTQIPKKVEEVTKVHKPKVKKPEVVKKPIKSKEELRVVKKEVPVTFESSVEQLLLQLR